MAVPLIREVKKCVDKNRNVILDAPPGTSCPVIETVKDSDFCILVTEPTPFGLHDLKITVQVLKDMKIPLGVVVNRAGIDDKKVYEYCEEENIPILLEIPFRGELLNFIRKVFPSAKKCQNGKKSLECCLMKQEGLLTNDPNHSFKWQGRNWQNDHNRLIRGFGKKGCCG
ncbi:MAG: hypothetical protein QXX08_06155 [Candidatus Bathyarchaeia archaeon]